ICPMILQHDDATGHATTPETVAERQGKQGDDPQTRRAQNESRVMLPPIIQKEHSMKRGHVTGHKHERKGHNWGMQTDEYKELIRQAEEEAAKQQEQQ